MGQGQDEHADLAYFDDEEWGELARFVRPCGWLMVQRHRDDPKCRLIDVEVTTRVIRLYDESISVPAVLVAAVTHLVQQNASEEDQKQGGDPP